MVSPTEGREVLLLSVFGEIISWTIVKQVLGFVSLCFYAI